MKLALLLAAVIAVTACAHVLDDAIYNASTKEARP
jgi:hypothetical protein